jgi:hypothetical protein
LQLRQLEKWNNIFEGALAVDPTGHIEDRCDEIPRVPMKHNVEQFGRSPEALGGKGQSFRRAIAFVKPSIIPFQ